MATATGLTYLFRYVGQVVGVASSASLLQAVLNTELHKRFTGPGSSKVSTVFFPLSTRNLADVLGYNASVDYRKDPSRFDPDSLASARATAPRARIVSRRAPIRICLEPRRCRLVLPDVASDPRVQAARNIRRGGAAASRARSHGWRSRHARS